MAKGFWLSDTQRARLAPLPPNKPRGLPHVDDHRVISGIIVAPQSGWRWIDVHAEYRLLKTLYSRFVRWPAEGVWQALLQGMAIASGRLPKSCSTAHKSRRTVVLRVERALVRVAFGTPRTGRSTTIHSQS